MLLVAMLAPRGLLLTHGHSLVYNNKPHRPRSGGTPKAHRDCCLHHWRVCVSVGTLSAQTLNHSHVAGRRPIRPQALSRSSALPETVVSRLVRRLNRVPSSTSIVIGVCCTPVGPDHPSIKMTVSKGLDTSSHGSLHQSDTTVFGSASDVVNSKGHDESKVQVNTKVKVTSQVGRGLRVSSLLAIGPAQG